MAREGAGVTLVDNRPEWVAVTRELLEAEGLAGLVVVCDVTDDDGCRRAVAETVEAYGGLDVLVNNVGVSRPEGTAVDVDPEEWDRGMAVNVKSMMLMAKHAVPAMTASDGGGTIINMTSVAGMVGGFPDLMYPTSKAAVIGMTRAMAAHHGGQGVRVNAIAPGLIYTPFVAAGGMSDAVRDQRRMQTVLQTEGTAWDVARAAVFLASDEARWITGAILPVDAGDTAIRQGVPYAQTEALPGGSAS
jgi:NAD(P)-dependent dehydrogenase (short-subunit alcohol dehydrogenase family)